MAKQGVTVEHLRKSYKKVQVLKDVSFLVEPGTIFALLGKNGAGKTTVINILATLIKSDAGTAKVDGFDVSKAPAKIRERIGLTGQFAAIDDILTGRENLELIAQLRHVSDASETATQLLHQFNLTDAANRRSMTYSGGMRRRLDIAMSLIGTPSVIFLDEPTTGLDPEARNDMWRVIRELAKNGTTVLLTTQYLEEADQLADRIAVLHNGEIVANGSPNELKKLVPKGFIELQFSTVKQCTEATKALKVYEITQVDPQSIRITSQDHTKQLADIFVTLNNAKLEPSSFSQTSPTLDDVFFEITKDQEEK